MALATLLGAVALAACAGAGRPIVAEVYYDAPGDDTGHEFVEFFNPDTLAHGLDGARLEAGDGSAPGRWTLRWTGGAGDVVAARSRFVVGGALVSPPPDAIATLELQNGPDALRVRWPDGVVEVVGWGALEPPEYFCGAPASDVAAGQSLARVPDGADTGSNAADFRAAAPSPGRANLPRLDLAVVPGTLALTPARPRPGAPAQAAFTMRNAGQVAVTDSALARLEGDALAAPIELPLPPLAAGESLAVRAPAVAGAAGRRTLLARLRRPGDELAGDDADSLAARIGDGPLELTEVQFHPADGEGEWLEVRNRTSEALEIGSFTLTDRGRTRGRIAPGPPIPADSLALIAQDREALCRAYPALDTARVRACSPWPSLNNSDGPDGIADGVSLAEADGLVSDELDYSASGVPPGATLEKRDGAWSTAWARGGTPLAPPLRHDPGRGGFDVRPRRVSAAAADVVLSWQLPWAPTQLFVELFDLEGHRVARLLESGPTGPRGEARARVSTGPGLFVAVLHARAGAGTLTRTAVLRVSEARP